MTQPTFESLNLSPEVNRALAEMKFTNPTPIQAEAIPVVMTGKDMVGQAQTGTGKTAAFAIPIIERIDISNRTIQAAIICPTRELAVQISEEFRKLAKFKPGLSIVSVYGGQPMDRQRLALQKRPQILIGTPGRMLDFLWRGTFNFNTVNTMVLDEADEMLNMGFRDDIEKIFGFSPETRQTILFSATMPKPIMEMTRLYQKDPQWIRVTPKPAEVSQITQAYLEVGQKAKPKALTHIIDEHDLSLALVFCNTKRQVDFLVNHLQMEGYSAEGLHGGKAQNQRERILGRFRKGAVKILVATDVAARGIDVRDVQAVVNYDLPEDMENYVHRIGRTGRAGQSGRAFSLVATHQANHLRQLQKSQGNAIERYLIPGMPQPEMHVPTGAPQKMGPQKPRRPFGGLNKSKPRRPAPAKV